MHDIAPSVIQKDIVQPAFIRGKNLLFLLYFGSGFCALAYEVVFVRLVKLTLGNTVYASSIVISVFMGGLALGSLVMAPFADRIKRPLRLYALLETLVGVIVASLPWLLKPADGVYRWIAAGHEPSSAAALIIQIAFSSVILLAPTIIMGSTLPLLGRYIATLQNNAGRLVGKLYAINMLGATLGCWSTGFILIKSFGIPGTIFIAVTVNIIVAAGGWLLSRVHDMSLPALPSGDAPLQTADLSTVQRGDRLGLVLLVAVFISGFVSIGYEIIWMRSIVFILSGYTYVFSAVLTMYLLGNVIGVGIGDFLLKKNKNSFFGFGVTLSCLGLAGICYIPALFLWNNVLGPHLYPVLMNLFHTDRIGYGRVLPLIHSAVLFIIPSIAMGIGFPLSLQAWNSSRTAIGKSTGIVYGINTVGAIAGGVLAGFILIPFFGVQKSITALGLLAVCMGAAVIQTYISKKSARRFAWLAAALIIIFGGLMIPSAIFTKSFVFHYPGIKLLAVREGVTTTASVHEEENGERFIATSNIQVAGDNKALFRISQKIFGHLGILLNQHARRVITVGFGSGETSRCMTLHSILDKVECVELSHEVVRLSLQFFDRLNLGRQLDEKVTMHYCDAKNIFHISPSRYDLIANDCINPKLFADNASLYTIEYFRDALSRLEANGLFATYLPVTEMPFSCTNSIMQSMADVFPYITIWAPVCAPSWYRFWYVVGSREPQSFSPVYIERQLADADVARSCRYVNFANSHSVLGCYIGDREDLKIYLRSFKDVPRNSDMRPWVEFSTDPIGTSLEKMKWLAGFYSFIHPENGGVLKYLDWTGVPQSDRERWIKEHECFQQAAGIVLKTQTTVDVDTLFHCARSLARIMPETSKTLDDHADILCDYLKSNIFGGNANALARVIDRLTDREMPDFWLAWLARSWFMQEKKVFSEALFSARQAVALSPSRYAARKQLSFLFEQAGQLDSAVIYIQRAIALAPDDRESQRMLENISKRLTGKQ